MKPPTSESRDGPLWPLKGRVPLGAAAVPLLLDVQVHIRGRLSSPEAARLT